MLPVQNRSMPLKTRMTDSFEKFQPHGYKFELLEYHIEEMFSYTTQSVFIVIVGYLFESEYEEKISKAKNAHLAISLAS